MSRVWMRNWNEERTREVLSEVAEEFGGELRWIMAVMNMSFAMTMDGRSAFFTRSRSSSASRCVGIGKRSARELYTDPIPVAHCVRVFVSKLKEIDAWHIG